MKTLVRHLLAAGAGAAFLAVAGAAAGAQSPSSSAGSSAQPQRTIQMIPALATLDHTLDAKKAKQGEAVTAKLEKDVDSAQQTLPKNTVLEGHVDQVQPSEHKSDSTVVVTFDKAKLKGGKEVPIKATVLAIAQPAYLQSASMGQPAGGGMPAGGGASAGGGGMARGGAAPTGGATPSGTTPNAPAEQQPMAAPNPNQAANAPSNGQVQQNGVPGVKLQSDIHQKASATFTSRGKNVHLPDGTQIDIALAVIPAGVRLQ